MKFKPLVIFLISSTVFLLCLISIWKIMSTLQGLNLTNLDIIENFFLSILLVILFLIIGQKLNHLIKVLLLSLLFVFIYFLIILVLFANIILRKTLFLFFIYFKV